MTDAEKSEEAAAVVVTSSEEYLTEWWTARVQDVFPPAYKITDHTSKVLEKVVDHLQPGCMVSPPSVLNMTRDRDEGPINSGLMEFTRKYIITDADRDLLRSATTDAWRLFPWDHVKAHYKDIGGHQIMSFLPVNKGSCISEPLNFLALAIGEYVDYSNAATLRAAGSAAAPRLLISPSNQEHPVLGLMRFTRRVDGKHGVGALLGFTYSPSAVSAAYAAFTAEDGPLAKNYPNLRNPFDHEVFTADQILRTKHDPFGGFRVTSVDALKANLDLYVTGAR